MPDAKCWCWCWCCCWIWLISARSVLRRLCTRLRPRALNYPFGAFSTRLASLRFESSIISIVEYINRSIPTVSASTYPYSYSLSHLNAIFCQRFSGESKTFTASHLIRSIVLYRIHIPYKFSVGQRDSVRAAVAVPQSVVSFLFSVFSFPVFPFVNCLLPAARALSHANFWKSVKKTPKRANAFCCCCSHFFIVWVCVCAGHKYALYILSNGTMCFVSDILLH